MVERFTAYKTPLACWYLLALSSHWPKIRGISTDALLFSAALTTFSSQFKKKGMLPITTLSGAKTQSVERQKGPSLGQLY